MPSRGARTAATAQERTDPAAGHHDHRPGRRAEGARGDEGRDYGFDRKPNPRDELFGSVEPALEHTRDLAKLPVARAAAATRLAGLIAVTPSPNHYGYDSNGPAWIHNTKKRPRGL